MNNQKGGRSGLGVVKDSIKPALQHFLSPAIPGDSLPVLGKHPKPLSSRSVCMHTCSPGVEKVMWSLKSSA